jgi:hypothetical protein
VLDLLDRGKPIDRNPVKTPAESGQGAHMGIDRRAPIVLDEIVVNVDPIHGRAGWVHLVEKRKVVVYEVG